MKDLVLDPAGMEHSTFLRADVPSELASSRTSGRRWSSQPTPTPTRAARAELDAALQRGRDVPVDARNPRRPQRTRADVAAAGGSGDPPLSEARALGWFLGAYHGHRTVGHSGADPGFDSRFVLGPRPRVRGRGAVELQHRPHPRRRARRARPGPRPPGG